MTGFQEGSFVAPISQSGESDLNQILGEDRLLIVVFNAPFIFQTCCFISKPCVSRQENRGQISYFHPLCKN